MKRTLSILTLILLLLSLAACNSPETAEPKSLTLADFSTADGSFQAPNAPAGMTEGTFSQYNDCSYEQYRDHFNEYVTALENGKAVADSAIVYTMYGFRCILAPTGMGSGGASGAQVIFIDDGQTEEQRLEMTEKLRADIQKFLVGSGSSWTSKDGQTSVMLITEPADSAKVDENTSVGGIDDEYVTTMYLTYEAASKTVRFPDGQLSPGQDMPEWMYAVKDVELRAFSHMDAPVTKTITNRIVQVLASAYYDEQWLLIYSPEADSSYGALGWVEATQLQEQARITELNYPVRLRPGAVDIDSGEIIEFLGADMVGEDIWAKEYTDDTITVYWEGGNVHRVSPNDVIIPNIIDGELRFIDEE